MAFVKKNIVSIICVLIIVIAIVVKFTVIDSLFDNLETDGKARVATAATLSHQLNDPSRVWPRVDPNQTQSKPLKQFPSKDVLQQGADIRKQGETQSAEMYSIAVENNHQGHPTLTGGSLAVLNQTEKVQFQLELKAAEDKLRNTVLRGTMPPTHEEMEARAKQIWDADFEPQKVIRDGQWVNEQELKQRYSEVMKQLPEKMRKERSDQFKLYMNAQALPISSLLLDSSHPMDADQTWFSQVSYWIQSDVAATIQNMNKSSPTIAEAPIKRLLSISVAPDISMYVQKEIAAPGGTPPNPQQGSTNPNPSDAVEPNYTLTPTGRVCNSIYDVVQFTLRVDVQVNDLQEFIDQLSHNRLLTVRNVNSASTVDYQQLAAEGYLFGNQPVVEVTLDCEELFLRQWTVPLMPSSVRHLLNISDDWKPWSPPPAVAEAVPHR